MQFVPSQQSQAPQQQPAPQSPPTPGMMPGMENKQAIESGAMQEPEGDINMENGQGGDVDSAMDKALGAITPDSQQLLAMYLTPEFAQLMTELMGEQVGGYFQKKADPEMILVPLNRQKVMAMQGEGELPQEIPGEVNASMDIGSEMPQQGTKESPRPGHVPAGTAPMMA